MNCLIVCKNFIFYLLNDVTVQFGRNGDGFIISGITGDGAISTVQNFICEISRRRKQRFALCFYLIGFALDSIRSRYSSGLFSIRQMFNDTLL